MKPSCYYAFQQNILYLHSAVNILFFTFSYSFQNVLPAPAPLRIGRFPKTWNSWMYIKYMEHQWFWGVQMLFWLSYFSCFASSTRVAKQSPFDSFSFSGLCRRTSFLVKTIAENLWCCFRFSAMVLSSSRCLVPRNESRRSLGYKGGVTRGREDQPPVNCSWKKRSPEHMKSLL